MKTPLIIFLTAFSYFALLSSKTYTWVFVSEDAADWLACSTMWMVPQPLGSPLYILLGQFLNILPGDLVIKMTMILSCLPSAITVTLVYLIVRHLTNKESIAITSAMVLAASAIFMSQSTILEEYALAVMLLTLGYYFYTTNKRKLTWLSLGLATAVHAFVLPIACLWLLIKWKWNIKALPIYIIIIASLYSLIPILMYLDTPRFCAGELNLKSIADYVLGPMGAVSGSLSVFDFPERAKQFAFVMSASLGISWIPLWYGLKGGWEANKKVLGVIIVFTLWFYLTCLFGTAWVFLMFAMPSTAILVGIGLNKLSHHHTKIIIGSSIILLILNSAFLNANLLTNENPVANNLYQEIMDLPEGSLVVGSPRYTITAAYAMSNGKDVILIICGYTDYDFKFEGYMDYLYEEWELKGEGTLGLIECGFDQGRRAYFSGVDRDILCRRIGACFELRGNGLVREIVGLTGSPFPSLSEASGSREP